MPSQVNSFLAAKSIAKMHTVSLTTIEPMSTAAPDSPKFDLPITTSKQR